MISSSSRCVALFVLIAASVAATACSRKDERPPVAAAAAVMPPSPVMSGRPVSITYRFTVPQNAPPFAEDYTVFVHALDKDGTRLWTSDHQPPTPTSRWKPGTVIEYTESMNVPSRTVPGRVQIDIGLYSPRSRDRLPLSGENDGRRAYKVGSFDVVAPVESVSTMYQGGWHDLEVPDTEQSVEWRWTAGKADLWLRNPKRDATLVLDVDQPIRVLSAPQHVSVLNASQVIDEFDLPPGKLDSRRIRLSAADLGEKAIVHFTIAVDKTFVPAKVPELRSNDARELGIRVFQAFLDSPPAR